MRILFPFLRLYRLHFLRITLGLLLTIVTLLSSIALLTLSGWFLAASAVAGFSALVTFNYMLPAAGVRGAAIIRTAGRYAERIVSHDATFRVLAHLRVFTFSKLIPLSPGAIARFRQAELLNRLVADVDTLDHLYLRLLSPLWGAIIVILVVTAGLSWFDPFLALTLGAIMLVLLFTLPLGFYHAGKPIGQVLTAIRADYRTLLITWLRGQSELAVYSALSIFRQRLTEKEQEWQQQQQRQATLTGNAQALMLLLSGSTLTLILWLAANGIGDYPQPGPLIALFLFATLSAFEALAPVAGAFQHLGQVMASASRVAQIINQKPEVTFPTTGVQVTSPIDVELDHISFAYPGERNLVLNDISLSIAAGEKIALLGRTGCGKSTLLQLLTRAWNETQGQIRFNGHLISHVDEASLRQLCGVVTQRIHIFSATLRDNLILANDKADDDQLRQILHLVGLDKLSTEQGLDTWLGEGGRPLSGGEQRRLGVARALLHDSPLLLLDEPTEGLDAETEKQIFQLIMQHCQHKTLLLVTHRLYGLAQMDRICVMDNGQIVEVGNHQALIKSQGRYYQLCQSLYLK